LLAGVVEQSCFHDGVAVPPRAQYLLYELFPGEEGQG
jgi:hypothetical protein